MGNNESVKNVAAASKSVSKKMGDAAKKKAKKQAAAIGWMIFFTMVVPFVLWLVAKLMEVAKERTEARLSGPLKATFKDALGTAQTFEMGAKEAQDVGLKAQAQAFHNASEAALDAAFERRVQAASQGKKNRGEASV